MGLDFIVYWFVVLAVAGWLTALTYKFALHRKDTKESHNKLSGRVGKLEYTVDDLIKVLKAVKEE